MDLIIKFGNVKPTQLLTKTIYYEKVLENFVRHVVFVRCGIGVQCLSERPGY